MAELLAFYDPVSAGFYQTDLHLVEKIPLTAIRLVGGAEERLQLVDGLASGKVMVLDSDGYPLLLDAPPPTRDQLAAAAKAKHQTLMSTATNRIAPLQDAADLGIATEKEREGLFAWKRYRVELSRLDAQDGYPLGIRWPGIPE